MPRKLNVLVLFDVPYAPPNGQDFRDFMRGDEWRDERDVVRALMNHGHDVAVFGIHDDIAPLVARIQSDRPDVVFNLCESFNADRKHEPNLMALLELLGVPYTGATPEGLSLCKDKGLTKKVLSFHDVRVPKFAVSSRPKRGVARNPIPKTGLRVGGFLVPSNLSLSGVHRFVDRSRVRSR